MLIKFDLPPEFAEAYLLKKKEIELHLGKTVTHDICVAGLVITMLKIFPAKEETLKTDLFQ